ncbi:MAG: DUF4115 domain-containing protein [Candidatus Omnitrophica bacterium]|nr:DUF4115 domain-containing protein [Candidatus Omnitrophota bacterium]
MARITPSKDKDQKDAISIGERLKRARLDKDVSIEEAHKATKIHPDVIKSMEEDKLEGSLGNVYAKAFLRTYAGYLGLDAAKIVDEYISKGKATSAEPQKEPPVLQRPVLQGRQERKLSLTVISVVAIALWLVLLGIAGSKFIAHFNSRSPIASRPKESIRAIKDIRVNQPKPNVQAPKGEDANFISIPKGRNITASIVTSKNLWIKVSQDGTVAFHGTLAANSKEVWRASEEILLSEIGRPEAFKLNVNGKEIDFTGRRPTKKILINQEGVFYLDSKE